jgi:hypothetical protein
MGQAKWGVGARYRLFDECRTKNANDQQQSVEPNQRPAAERGFFL